MNRSISAEFLNKIKRTLITMCSSKRQSKTSHIVINKPKYSDTLAVYFGMYLKYSSSI